MHIDITLANLTLRGGAPQLGPNLARAATLAEQAGLGTVWVMDHFFQIPPVGPAEMDMLEGYSTLSFLAAHTKRVRLGTMVTGITYRHPGVLIKTVTTLDVLSGGRAWFGLGAAWFDREHLGLGVPFPPLGERFERVEECLQIALQMWSGNNGPYRGKHYQLQETLCVPQPLSKPRPPIMIGGGGEKKTLRLVAQYAEGCNLFGDAATVAHKLGVLRGHCERLGRDYGAIDKTVMVVHQRDPAKLLAELASLAAVGVDGVVIAGMDPTDEGNFEVLAKTIVPQAAGLAHKRQG
jgi:F420-dependent oxidoreductase-like protein